MEDTLDARVARLVSAAHLLERALHGDHKWSMRWRDHEVPAERVLTETSVTFHAAFPRLGDNGDSFVWLLCDGDVVRCQSIDIEGAAPLDMEWGLTLEAETAPVS